MALVKPLTIGYSDWPGWLVLEIGKQKGFFNKDAGVDVEFKWFEYGPSIDAYAAGQLDGILIVCGDSLVTGAGGKPSVAIVLTDYSSGNDMIIGKEKGSIRSRTSRGKPSASRRTWWSTCCWRKRWS